MNMKKAYGERGPGIATICRRRISNFDVKVFRGKYLAGVRQAYVTGQLRLGGSTEALAEPTTFAAWLAELYRLSWVVYAKKPFGRNPERVLKYLARYTHRVASQRTNRKSTLRPSTRGAVRGARPAAANHLPALIGAPGRPMVVANHLVYAASRNNRMSRRRADAFDVAGDSVASCGTAR
jgi:hypothetical protein